MKKAKNGDSVKVHYEAKVGDKTIFSSLQTSPLQLTIGKNQILLSFEKAIIGMQEGDQKNLSISSENAFGPYLKNLIYKVKKDKILGNAKLEIGKTLQIKKPDGNLILVKILSMDDTTITFDANHPLAGKNIDFSIKLLEIE